MSDESTDKGKGTDDKEVDFIPLVEEIMDSKLAVIFLLSGIAVGCMVAYLWWSRQTATALTFPSRPGDSETATGTEAAPEPESEPEPSQEPTWSASGGVPNDLITEEAHVGNGWGM